MVDVYVSNQDWQNFQGDNWMQQANGQVADQWATNATGNAGPMVADAQDRADASAQQQAAAQAQAQADAQQQAAATAAAQAGYAQAAQEQANNDAANQWQANAYSDTATRATGVAPQTVKGPMQPATTATTDQTSTGQSTATVTPSSPLPSSSSGNYVALAWQDAQKYGIDPNIFVRQIQQESGFQPFNSDGSVKTSGAGARGIAQIIPSTAQAWGVNPDDPVAALDAAAKNMSTYVQKYSGDYAKALAAYNAGEGNVDKFGGVPPFAETQTYVNTILNDTKGVGSQLVSEAQAGLGTVANTVQNASDQAAKTGLTAVNTVTQGTQAAVARTSQFAMGLSSGDAYAFCGPAAALAFAATYGRNPTVEEAKALAQQVGWTPGQGMAGPQSEVNLLNQMGVSAHMTSGVDWNTVASDSQSGNPVIIDTPGHYYYVDGYNASTGQLHVGTSGTDLKGGSEWMTPDQINNMPQSGGAARAAIYADHPLSGGTGVAAQAAGTAGTGGTAPARTALPQQAPGAGATNMADFIQRYQAQTGQMPDDTTLGNWVSQNILNQNQQNQPQQTFMSPLQGAGNAVQGGLSVAGNVASGALGAAGGLFSGLTPLGGGPPTPPNNNQQQQNNQPSVPLLTGLESGLQTAGNDISGALSGAGNLLGNAANTVGSALPDITPTLQASNVPGGANSPLGRIAQGQNVSPAEQLVAAPQIVAGYEQARTQAANNLNPLANVPVIGPSITQLTDPLTLAGAAGVGPGALVGGVVGSNAAGQAAQQLVSPDDPNAGVKVTIASLLGGLPGAAAGGNISNILDSAFNAVDTISPPELAAASTAFTPEARAAQAAKFAGQREANAALWQRGGQPPTEVQPPESLVTPEQPTAPAQPQASPLEPFGLTTTPVEGAQPLSDEETLQRFQGLEQQYTANDQRIAQLEDQLHESSNPGVAPLRPPWAGGIPNNTLIDMAHQYGESAYAPLWWERAGLETGSGELREALSQGAGRASQRVNQPTLADARAQLNQLRSDNQAIMDASDAMVNAQPGTLYSLPQTGPAALPFDTGTNAVRSAGGEPVAATLQPPATLAAGGEPAGAAPQVAAPSGPTTGAGVTQPAAGAQPARPVRARAGRGANVPTAGAQAAAPAQQVAQTDLLQGLLDQIKARGDADPAEVQAMQSQIDELRASTAPPATPRPVGDVPAPPNAAQIEQLPQVQAVKRAANPPKTVNPGDFGLPPPQTEPAPAQISTDPAQYDKQVSDALEKQASAAGPGAAPPPTPPPGAGIPMPPTGGTQPPLPSMPTPRPGSFWQVLNAYHTGNIIMGPATLTKVAANTAFTPAWNYGTQTARDLLTLNLDRAMGRTVGVQQAFVNMGSDFVDAFAQAMANRTTSSIPLVDAFLKAQRAAGGAMHAGLQNVAAQSVRRMELGAAAGEQAAAENGRGVRGLGKIGSLIRDPSGLPASAVARADDLAQRAGLRAPAGATEQMVNQMLSQAANTPAGAVTNFLLPVFRIGAQATARMVEASPVGLLGTTADVARGFAGFGPYAHSFNVPGGAVTPLADRLVNNIAGTAVTAWLASKALDGTITGTGPDNPNQRANMEAQGWRPQSVLVPGVGYVSYTRLPEQLKGPLMLAGAYGDAVQQHPGDPTGQAGRLAQEVASMFAQGAPGLSTLADIGGILKGDPYAVGYLVGGSAAGYIPGSALLGNIATGMDPYARKIPTTQGFGPAILANIQQTIPGARQQLQASTNVLGQNMPNTAAGLSGLLPWRTPGDVTTGTPGVQALRVLNSAGMALGGAPSAVTLSSGARITLTDDEKPLYERDRAAMLDQMTAGLANNAQFQAAPLASRRQVLQRLITRADDIAGRQVVASIAQNGDLGSRLELPARRTVPASAQNFGPPPLVNAVQSDQGVAPAQQQQGMSPADWALLAPQLWPQQPQGLLPQLQQQQQPQTANAGG